MHRCDNADSNGTATGKYDGSVAVYRDQSLGSYNATQLRHQEMNAIQEEIANVIRGEGIPLQTDAEAANTMFQLETAINNKLKASRIQNDSTIPGAYVDDAFNNLSSDDIANDSGVSGVDVSDALDQLDTDIGALGTDDITNDSLNVPGTTASNAIDDLGVRQIYDQQWGKTEGFDWEVRPGTTGQQEERVYFESDGWASRVGTADRHQMLDTGPGAFNKRVINGATLQNWVVASGNGGCASTIKNLPATPITTVSGTTNSGSSTITSVSSTANIEVGDIISSVGFAPCPYVRVVSLTSNSITVHMDATSSGATNIGVYARPLFVFALSKEASSGLYNGWFDRDFGFDTDPGGANLLSDASGGGWNTIKRLGQIIISGRSSTVWRVHPMAKCGNRYVLNEAMLIWDDETSLGLTETWEVPVPLRIITSGGSRYRYADVNVNFRNDGDTGQSYLHVWGNDGTSETPPRGVLFMYIDNGQNYWHDQQSGLIPVRASSVELRVKQYNADIGEVRILFRGFMIDESTDWA